MDIFVSFLSTLKLWENECPYAGFSAQRKVQLNSVFVGVQNFWVKRYKRLHQRLWLWPRSSISDLLHCNGFDVGPEVCNMSLFRTLYNNYPLFWVSGPVCQTIWGHLVLFHHCLFSHRKPINVSRLHPFWKRSERELVSHCFNICASAAIKQWQGDNFWWNSYTLKTPKVHLQCKNAMTSKSPPTDVFLALSQAFHTL